MSFWVKQPLNINDTSAKQILDGIQLLEKTNTIIKESKSKLDYTVATLDENTLNTAFDFINEHYSTSDSSRLLYSKQLLRYFLHDSLLIFFQPIGKSDIVGLIVGKKKLIQIEQQEFSVIDVNFLCLKKKLRNISLAPFMIAVLTKESLTRLNISLAHYTISARINSPCFGKKQLYHRPINIAHLVNSGFFKVSIPNFERIYNTFTNTTEPLYLNDIIPNKELINNLDEIISLYNKKTYKIFDIKSIGSVLENPMFHSFAFWEQDTVCDFISIFRLDSQAKTGDTYKNGYLYIVALKSQEPEHIEKIFNSVAKYCYEHKIVDMLTLSDLFPNTIYNQIKFTPGTGILNYYVFNMDMICIENSKNGLITI